MKISSITSRSSERQPSTREEVIINILKHVQDILAKNFRGVEYQIETVEQAVTDVLDQNIRGLDADSLGELLRARSNVGFKRTLIEQILGKLRH